MQAETVTGLVHASDLGVVLPHEHLNTDARFLCQALGRPFVSVAEAPAGEIRQRPMDFVDNLDMRDEAVATTEVGAFASAGGRTIVDLTTIELGRDPAMLQRLSRTTGVQVIMATGYYVRKAHPAELATLGVDGLAARFVREIEVGIDGIRAGVIGEIGTDDPVDPAEERVLRAAARAHLETGCPINIHFAAKCREVHRVLDLLVDEGIADLGGTIISHMDVAIDLDQQREVAERGAFVEYDTFGHETYPDSKGNVMPRDEERVESLAQLVAWGYGERVLVSHDVCMKTLWQRFGGRGYTNLLARVRPMMTAAGLDDAVQRALFVSNPARVFAFRPDA